ncbi:hypothetical protein HPT29_017235 [Microvirga terrae]|uniref:Uncharacterized protein n=1 Tax=Microvirga terrae TaxID=2740529 RepID=A0ABY5RPG4_9HYPH|nr:hypothetical protein [Microvirga terrae]UVF18246.1 hypothetical protein HPT29_017235 [Microvirga terrae]
MTRPAIRSMVRPTVRTPRAPKAARDGQCRPALVFRDFVRQLEKLDATAGTPSRVLRGAVR